MSTTANPYDFRHVGHGDFEVYDTRDGRVLRVCIAGSTAAEAEADRLWHAELLAAPESTPPAPTPPQPRRLGGPDFSELAYLTSPAGCHITNNLAEALRQIGPDADLAALTEAALASIGVRCRLPIADVQVVRRWRLTQGQAVSVSWWLREQLQARDSEARPMGLDELGERLRVSVARFVGRLDSYAA